MDRQIRLGMLTPSSNTVLEPVTVAMLRDVRGISVHFSRFAVTEIGLDAAALAQFDVAPILAAATLLSHAKVDVIAWNGTSSSWLGHEADEALCRQITAATGIPACTSMLAMNERLRADGVRRFGLVTPYTDDVQQRIIANYARLGINCPVERHLGIRDNHAFADVPGARLATMIREVAAGRPEGRPEARPETRPEAIGIICTNLNAASQVAALERETGVPIYDSIATALWKSLLIAGADPSALASWGRLFQR
jgi:maleate isomerase